MATKGEINKEKILAKAESLILQKGYAGMTLDELLEETGLTKGAFFHHFKGKAGLAKSVLERYASNDYELFKNYSDQADRLSDDPLERVLIFIKLFEEFLNGLENPFPGCIFSSYSYEVRNFEPEIGDYIKENLNAWLDLYENKLGALIKARPPALPVTARELSEMIGSIIEGSFVMTLAMKDKSWTQRQSAQYRHYIELLFRT